MADEVVNLVSSDDEPCPVPVVSNLITPSKAVGSVSKTLRIRSMFEDDSDDEVLPVPVTSAQSQPTQTELPSLLDEESDEEVLEALRSKRNRSAGPAAVKATTEKLKRLSRFVGDHSSPYRPMLQQRTDRHRTNVEHEAGPGESGVIDESYFDNDDLEGDISDLSDLPTEDYGDMLRVQNTRRALDLMHLNHLSSDATEELPTPTEMDVILLKHQRQALAWMVKREAQQEDESVPRGGILADDQGFGKTLSMIALMLQNKPSQKEDGSPAAWGTLLVTPTSIMQQWAGELETRIDEEYRPRVLIYHGHNKVKDPYVLVKYDVVITSYATLVQEYPKVTRRNGRKPVEWRRKGPLFRVKWFRVILDEAQAIRNFRSESFHACIDLKTERRWSLTGTPIQNTIDDMYAQYIFLRYFVVESYKHWKDKYKRPLEGKCTAARRSKVFQEFQLELGVVLLRRAKTDKIDGQPVINLPAKHVNVLNLKFSSTEAAYYHAQECRAMQDLQRFGIEEGFTHVLVLLLRLRQACGHPALCEWDSGKEFQFSDDELDGVLVRMQTRCMYKVLPESVKKRLFVELGPGTEVAQTCPICLDIIEGDGMVTKCGHIFCTSDFAEWQKENDTCPTCRTFVGSDGDKVPLAELRKEIHVLDREKKRGLEEVKVEEGKKSAVGSKKRIVIEIGGKRGGGKRAGESPPKRPRGGSGECNSTCDSEDEGKDKDNNKASHTSTKIKAFMAEYKKIYDTTEDKVLCFSQWARMLDLVETQLDEEGYEYVRLDGSLSPDARAEAIRLFKNRSKCRLFLISLKAGSTGLNLTMANRVFLLDSWWNPAVEDQAVDRVHRIGQTKEVHVVRLKIEGSIEETILQLQEKKRSLMEGALGVEGLKTLGRRRLTMEDVLELFSGVAENVANRTGHDEVRGLAMDLFNRRQYARGV